MARIYQQGKAGKWYVQFRWDRTAPYSKAIGTTDKEKAEEKKREIEDTIRYLRDGVKGPIPDDADVATWIFTRGTMDAKPDRSKKRATIADAIDEWMKHLELLVSSGQKRQATYQYHSERLTKFKAFANSQPISALPDVLLRWKQDGLGRISRGENAARTISHELKVVAMFARKHVLKQHPSAKLVAALEDYVDIKCPDPEPEFFTKDETKTLYELASGRDKLFILLALNGGYGQTDIAELRHDHIDWDTGIIKRFRHKTKGKKKTVQSVKMWQSTQRLLKVYMTDPSTSELALLGMKGNPLVERKIKSDGRAYTNDAIAQSFKRLRKTAGIDKGFYIFRHTGANEIEQHYPDHPHLSLYYLADSEQTMKVSYTERNFKLLHEATDWLGKHLGLDK